MKILVIPEDFRKDQYIIKPLVQALFQMHGKPHANIRICNPPLLQGISEALKSERLREVVERYRFVDLIILCVDRDGELGRQTRLDQIEAEFGLNRHFFAEQAWEELETWTLAGLPLPKDWTWRQVREEISVKELYFEKLADLLQVSDGPGGGRKALGELASKSLPAIISKCPEDFGKLSLRIQNFINGR